MKFLTAKSQMTLGLVCLQVSVLCGAMLFGLVPEQKTATMKGRADLCESLAVISSQLIAKGQFDDLHLLLTEMVARNDSIISAAIRRTDESGDGELLAEIGNHEEHWHRDGERSTENEVLVPIQTAKKEEDIRTDSSHSLDHSRGTRWGNVELRFTAVSATGLASFYKHPWVQMTVVISLVSGVLFYFYLRKMLKHLDPSKAVPQRVRAALDSLAEGLLVLDRQERIVLANQAFADWVDVSPDKLTGVDAASFTWITCGKSVFSSGYPWTDALQQEKAQAGVMISLNQVGKPRQNLMANASPVLGHDGQYGGVLVSFDDVTQLEETRKDLNDAKEVAEKAQEMAEEANSAKSEFLARMSHEIRTPMNAILGYTEVLRSGYEDEKEEDRYSYLDTIHASGEHLLALINDILDLSKIESGQMGLDRNRCSLRELITQVVSVMNVKAKEKDIALTFEASGLLPETILTDAVRFRQAVFNLVGNAVKFTETGGVRIVVSLNKAGQLQVDVIDSGVGIAADAVDRVFERFTQADASVSTKFGGTGLGLSISKQLARMMGGDITLVSVLGEGSTFTLTVNPGDLDGIELVDPTVATSGNARRSHEAESLKLPPCHIMIVDDEEANRRLAGIYINRAGAEFCEARNGQEAVDMASAQDFDIILMDFNMPVMGGLDATRELRRLGNQTPVIALTANVMQDDKDAATQAGCNGFLTKPIKMKELVAAVHELLPACCHDRKTPVAEVIEPPKPAATADNGITPPAGTKVDVATTDDRERNDRQPTDVDALLSSIDSLLNPVPPVTDTPSHAAGSEPVQSGDANSMHQPSAASFEQGSGASHIEDPIESTLPIEDPEFYEIVADFPARLNDRVNSMTHSFETETFTSLREHAHWLAGTGETLGFAPFTEPARKLESAAEQGHVQEMSEALREIVSLAQRVVVRPPSTV